MEHMMLQVAVMQIGTLNTCEAPVIREHKHCFYRPDALLPPNSVKALKENVLDYTTLEMNALS